MVKIIHFNKYEQFFTLLDYAVWTDYRCNKNSQRKKFELNSELSNDANKYQKQHTNISISSLFVCDTYCFLSLSLSPHWVYSYNEHDRFHSNSLRATHRYYRCITETHQNPLNSMTHSS